MIPSTPSHRRAHDSKYLFSPSGSSSFPRRIVHYASGIFLSTVQSHIRWCSCEGMRFLQFPCPSQSVPDIPVCHHVISEGIPESKSDVTWRLGLRLIKSKPHKELVVHIDFISLQISHTMSQAAVSSSWCPRTRERTQTLRIYRLSQQTLPLTLSFLLLTSSCSRPKPRKVQYPAISLDTCTHTMTGLTFDALAKELGKDEIWVASAFYGQVRANGHIRRGWHLIYISG